MPTYDYKCDACGRAWEKSQSIKADPIKTCPHCGQETARRLIGMGAGLIFKGSGFYITDYRDKAYADKAKAEGGGDAKPEAKPDGKTEASPATSESKPAAEAKPAATPTPTPSPTPTAAPAAKAES